MNARKFHAALISASIILSGISSPSFFAAAQETNLNAVQNTSAWDKITAAEHAVSDAITARAIVTEYNRTAGDVMMVATLDFNDAIKDISYGEAGEHFNAGVTELNNLVPGLGLPKIGEAGGPVAIDKLTDVGEVDSGIRPFASEDDYNTFNDKLRKAYQTGGNNTLSGLGKINGNRDAMKNAIQPFYTALSKFNAQKVRAAEIQKDGQDQADKSDNPATLQTYKDLATAGSAAEMQALNDRLAELKAKNYDTTAAEKPVATAQAALDAFTKKLAALPDNTAPSAAQQEFWNAQRARNEADKAIVIAKEALNTAKAKPTSSTAPTSTNKPNPSTEPTTSNQKPMPAPSNNHSSTSNGILSFFNRIFGWFSGLFDTLSRSINLRSS